MEKMKRIIIIGTSSSGKTTLAKQLAQKLSLTHQELDALFWEPHWTEAKVEDFRKRVTLFVKEDKWVTDGNYSSVRDLVWGRATDVIWLDYSFYRVIRQFFKRSITRSFKREELWNGNRETLWNSILKPNSLLMWILKSYKRNKKVYSKLCERHQFPHITFHHFKHPKDTEDFVSHLS